ncbi:MAG: DNA gyrase subunit A [DPANN group archaeon]|nr:DNA gyrase subunit A [DPANN group archaeon]
MPREIEDEMKQSYLDYAMSVIVGRALPDVRDGLKPVHRRILYAMSELNLLHAKPFKKSARIVGEVLGKYHPHGDTAVYDALVRMAQNFSLRYPLVDGQGNFGSVDGDRAAAMRYTEARMQKLAEEMLVDIDKETVDFTPNFDDSLKEPSVLPARVPNLLVNGSAGIAVGMATNIPPHNLSEVAAGVIRLVDNPELTPLELMDTIKGPDFPTGARIIGLNGIRMAYKTGHGKVKIRSVHTIEKKGEHERIVVTQIPYMVNKAQMIEQIAGLVKDKKVQGIADIRDESDKDGIRIVIDLKRDANDEIVVNQLLKHSRLQVTFGINMLGLVENQPRVLNLHELLSVFIDHRKQVVTRKTAHDLRKAEERAHLLEGLIVALDHIDRIIALIRGAKETAIAKKELIESYDLSERQAVAILEMRLQRLTGLEREKIRKEHRKLLELIKELKAILGDVKRIYSIIKEDMRDVIAAYGDPRRTEILDAEEDDIDIEDLIESEYQVVTVTRLGYVKRQTLDAYRKQNRGGKGIIGTGTRDEDFVEKIFVANTHSFILCFTESGQVHWLKVYQIPEGTRTSKGKPIVNLIEKNNQEKVTAMIAVRRFEDDKYLLLATRKGIIKKTVLSAYAKPRRGGIRAIILDKDDRLIGARITDGSQNILLATKNGNAIKFSERDARPIGRTAKGVIGMRLKGDDEVIGMVVASEDRSLLTITEKGYGKRTPLVEYSRINRGGLGVINIKVNERNGKVVAIRPVDEEDEMMIISRSGIIIRIPVRSVSKIGRNTQGVRIMRLKKDDQVVSAARVIHEEQEILQEEEVAKEEDQAAVNIVETEDDQLILEQEDIAKMEKTDQEEHL